MTGKEALRCAGISRFVDTYIDAEFAEADRLEFEQHLSECDSCRHKVREQKEWKQAIRAAAPRGQAPAALRNRVMRQIARESRPMVSWRRWAARALPTAAAVGILASVMISKMQWSPLAADVVAKHQRNLPIEVSGGTDLVKQWYAGMVDFPVRPPQLHNVPAAAPGSRPCPRTTA
jgi:mycothiol system anti-sigma-R factor